jgi:hypothetical protein
MPRYYFNLYLEGTLLPDAEGQELRNADEAWEAARAAAVDLMQTGFQRPVNWFTCHFDVRDEADETVLEFPFAEAVETSQQPN